nr:P-loop NTPase domain-containing protein LPA1 homolog isoform X3 [Physcomitrium patens]|eukprot:XP_024393745.1 P-loop NTPase domain-containing protein LPA1 homolog isoform X3 [Physcomitrella patens]
MSRSQTWRQIYSRFVLFDSRLSFRVVSKEACCWIQLMERRGYGAEYIERYKMMTRFHHQRTPLIIIVCGTACVGKSTLATQLAQRLNLPNVLQTDMVYELLRTSTDSLNIAPLSSTPLWARDFASSEELIREFCRECRIVRKGLDGDLKKAMKDGKPVIIEGLHLDPSIYLMNEESGGFGSGVVQMKALPSAADTVTVAGIEKDGATSDAVMNKEISKEPIKWTPPKCIFVPIVLKMADVDHRTLLEEWISARAADTETSVSKEDKEALIKRLQTIEDYLTSFESQGLTVVNLSATTFPQTLDWMHSYLLECIKQGSTQPCSRAGS